MTGDTEGETGWGQAQPGWKIRVNLANIPAGGARQCQGIWVKGLEVTWNTQKECTV